MDWLNLSSAIEPEAMLKAIREMKVTLGCTATSKICRSSIVMGNKCLMMNYWVPSFQSATENLTFMRQRRTLPPQDQNRSVDDLELNFSAVGNIAKLASQVGMKLDHVAGADRL